MTGRSPNRSAVPRTIAFYTDARAWGGAEVYLTQLACGLRRAGYETPLFVADWGEVDAWVEHLTGLGFDVTRFRHGKEFSPRVYSEARRLLAGFELVHVNKTHPRNCLSAILGARSGGVPNVVTTEHLALPPDSRVPFGRPIITSLVRWTNRRVDRIVAVSELSRGMLIDHYGVPPDRITAIRNGLDIGALDAARDAVGARRSLGLTESSVAAVLVGRMAERKGHALALRAIPAIRERIPGYRLVLVGEGETEQTLRRLSTELGVDDHVVWAGFRRDVPDILSCVDLLMLPSEDECLPFVILEAMGARLPVVATDVGGISEQVEDGVTGRLIRPRDVAGLADAVAGILERPDRGASLGEAGRAKLEREFSVDTCVEAVLDVYAEVCSEGEE